MEEKNELQQINMESFQLLKHIPEETMGKLFDIYTQYKKMTSQSRYSSIGVVITIGISKLLFGGKLYTPSQINNILTGVVTISVIFIIVAIIFGVKSIKPKKELKNELNKIVAKNQFNKTAFLSEFNFLIKHFHGGPGIKKL